MDLENDRAKPRDGIRIMSTLKQSCENVSIGTAKKTESRITNGSIETDRADEAGIEGSGEGKKTEKTQENNF